MDRTKLVTLFILFGLLASTATASAKKHLWGGFILTKEGSILTVLQNNQKEVKLKCNETRTSCTGIIYEIEIPIKITEASYSTPEYRRYETYFNDDPVIQVKCVPPQFVQNYIKSHGGEAHGFGDACWL
jgi:hypothetical protein